MYADSNGHSIRSNGFETVAFSVRADHFEYRALPVVSKTVMGHWPIESSNLSHSAIPNSNQPLMRCQWVLAVGGWDVA
jgi:hypothetical protein